MYIEFTIISSNLIDIIWTLWFDFDMSMIFGSRPMIRRLSDFKLPLLGKELLPSESIKDLGVTFDPTLSFDNHILATVSSCISRLAQIDRAKHAFNSGLLVTIINALVFSKLYYCSTVWSSTTACNVQKLQLVQNFAARIISGTYKAYNSITQEFEVASRKKSSFTSETLFPLLSAWRAAPRPIWHHNLSKGNKYKAEPQETHNNWIFPCAKPLLVRDLFITE